MLNDIVGLTPNHESRLEAIERAEKLREKERDMMKLTKFQEELGDFVEDKKLKNQGIEEIEKQRQLRDIENLKSSFGVYEQCILYIQCLYPLDYFQVTLKRGKLLDNYLFNAIQ